CTRRAASRPPARRKGAGCVPRRPPPGRATGGDASSPRYFPAGRRPGHRHPMGAVRRRRFWLCALARSNVRPAWAVPCLAEGGGKVSSRGLRSERLLAAFAVASGTLLLLWTPAGANSRERRDPPAR